MVRAWLAGMGDGGAVVGIPTGIGVAADGSLLPAVTPVEAMPVRDQLRRVQCPPDQPVSRISLGRRPAELLRLIPARS